MQYKLKYLIDPKNKSVQKLNIDKLFDTRDEAVNWALQNFKNAESLLFVVEPESMRRQITISEDSFHTIISCLINAKIDAEETNDKDNNAFIEAISKALEELKEK